MTAPTSAFADLWTRWVPALEGLRTVPAQYRKPTLSLRAAARELGCGQELLESLVGAGMPALDTSDGLRFDYHDVMNLGLRAGAGRSTAELGERQCIRRMASGSPASWAEERTWHLRLSASCDGAGCPEPRPAVLSPAPHLLGGSIDQQTEMASGEQQLTVLTMGSRKQPRRPTVLAIFNDMLSALRSGRYQYGWVPRELSADYPASVAHGLVNCVVAADLMRDWAVSAGLQARARKGLLLGVVSVEHSWVEVLDDDQWVVLDPVLAFLATRHPGCQPEYTDFCRGSIHHRMLAWAGDLHQPLVDHRCRAGGTTALICRVGGPATTPEPARSKPQQSR